MTWCLRGRKKCWIGHGVWVEEHCQISHQLARVGLGFLDLESLSLLFKPLLLVVCI